MHLERPEQVVLTPKWEESVELTKGGNHMLVGAIIWYTGRAAMSELRPKETTFLSLLCRPPALHFALALHGIGFFHADTVRVLKTAVDGNIAILNKKK